MKPEPSAYIPLDAGISPAQEAPAPDPSDDPAPAISEKTLLLVGVGHLQAMGPNFLALQHNQNTIFVELKNIRWVGVALVAVGLAILWRVW